MVFNIKKNKKLRDKNYIRVINKIIQSYIKNPNGDLNLSNTPIHVLPNNLKLIDGDLFIARTKINKLPDDLIVLGDLIINFTTIYQLPDNITIEGDLWCFSTGLTHMHTYNELKEKYNIKGLINGIKVDTYDTKN